MNRSLIVKIHLALASAFIPFMLLMPLSGSLYIFGIKGEAPKTEVMAIETSLPAELGDKELFFRKFFAEKNIDFDFEYIKETPTELIFRPTSRDYYTATLKDGTWTLFQVKPNLVSKMMELHKGHGPQLMKRLEGVFGVALILVLLSGLWLALTIPVYRKITLASAGIGLALWLLLLL